MLMNPDKYSRGIIASHLLEAFYNKCLAQLSYESRDSAERAPSTVTEPVVEEKEELVIS